MKELEISAGYYTKAGSGRKNKKRVKQANARAQKRFKETRQKIRIKKILFFKNQDCHNDNMSQLYLESKFTWRVLNMSEPQIN
jgi:hypothetical protein